MKNANLIDEVIALVSGNAANYYTDCTIASLNGALSIMWIEAVQSNADLFARRLVAIKKAALASNWDKTAALSAQLHLDMMHATI